MNEILTNYEQKNTEQEEAEGGDDNLNINGFDDCNNNIYLLYPFIL